MNKIEQTYLIPATLAQVWRALTDPKVIEEWSGADAEFEPTVGFAYALWDKSICGKIIEVMPRKKLVQSWKPTDWTIENSVVTFTLSSVAQGTRVDLFHENVEEFDFEGTTEGWDLYYLGAIKRMFEAKPGNTKPGNAKTAKGTKAAKGKKTAAKKKVAVKKSVKRTASQKKK